MCCNQNLSIKDISMVLFNEYNIKNKHNKPLNVLLICKLLSHFKLFSKFNN